MKSNKALRSLFLFNGVFSFAFYLLGPLYAIFAEGLNVTVFQISLSYSVLLIADVLGSLVIRQWGDSVRDKKKLLLVGFGLRIIGWLGFIFVVDFTSLLFALIILGLGEACGSPAFDTIVARHLDKGEEMKEYSSWHIIDMIMGALAATVGGLIVTTYGFSVLFIIMSVLASISFLGIVFTPKEIL